MAGGNICGKLLTQLLSAFAVSLFLSLFCFGLSAQAAAKPFVVFDALSFKGKADLTSLGMRAILVIDEAELLYDKGDNHNQPNVEKIAAIARSLKPGSVASIDIECWRVNDPNPDVALASIEKYVQVARIFKKEAPSVRIGFYGVLPVRDHWRANGKEGATGFSQWQKENDALKPIAEVVDYIFPSLYTLDADPQ